MHKVYELGVFGSSSLIDEFAAAYARMRSRPDPRRVADTHPVSQRAGNLFWSLRGVDFSVQEGEVLGVIGRNGAGKSTLLKLLSRISVPTKGRISMRGKVSSLLEVGTGFHPELTGIENIYLNGAILGMRKAEIDRKLDEIIAFSGIEHYLETPIKRYSSGMKVRLGFAVAAHLEPELLIVDEVLAVGDAEFQRKCLGKMHDVAGSGRTVLFVSHNMSAVRNLCGRSIWLADGLVRQDGPTEAVVNDYLNDFNTSSDVVSWDNGDQAPGNAIARLRSVLVRPTNNGELIRWEDPVDVEVQLDNLTAADGDLFITIHVSTVDENIAFVTGIRESLPDVRLALGRNRMCCTIPGFLLNVGTYRISVLVVHRSTIIFRADQVLEFNVQEGAPSNTWLARRPGYFRIPIAWKHDLPVSGSGPT